jgi:exodeoxyribonuclease VII large subunit
MTGMKNEARPDVIYTVSRLTEEVKALLGAAFSRVWVEGEVSNFKRHTSGHLYFCLKDDKTQLKAVMFRAEARAVAFDLQDGLQVVCRGRISVYETRGEYQLYADLVEPKGKGALQLAFEQLKEKLRAEGLFEEARKKPLPLRPRTIGIVTSPTGAAIRDILRILKRRFAGLHLLLYPAKVQGAGAADEIVEGLRYFARRPGVDVIIAGRGGGSLEDLWPFNEEKVARAIFASPVPVISAVGHEVDFTIADFTADVRASTPSAAAELVVRTEAEFRDRIDDLARRAGQLVRLDLRARREEVGDLARHRIFENFRVRLANLGRRVDDLESRAWKVVSGERRALTEKRSAVALWEERLANLVRTRLRDGRSRWTELAAVLNSLSPLAVLKKGYAVVWKDGGLTLVKGVRDLAAGDDVIVSFARGEFRAEVRSVDAAASVAARFVGDEKGEE